MKCFNYLVPKPTKTLLIRQKSLGEKIEEAPAKFKRAGSVKKTVQYFERRLGELEDWVEELKENNELILKEKESTVERDSWVRENYFFSVVGIGEKLMEDYKAARDEKFPRQEVENDGEKSMNVSRTEERERIIEKIFNLRSTSLQSLVEKLILKQTMACSETEIEFDQEKLQEIFKHYVNAYEKRINLSKDGYELEGLAIENEELIESTEELTASEIREILRWMHDDMFNTPTTEESSTIKIVPGMQNNILMIRELLKAGPDDLKIYNPKLISLNKNDTKILTMGVLCIHPLLEKKLYYILK